MSGASDVSAVAATATKAKKAPRSAKKKTPVTREDFLHRAISVSGVTKIAQKFHINRQSRLVVDAMREIAFVFASNLVEQQTNVTQHIGRAQVRHEEVQLALENIRQLNGISYV
jgi:histone H3/H4